MEQKKDYPRPRRNRTLLEKPVSRETLEVINANYDALRRELCLDRRCYGGVDAEDILHDTIERVIREGYPPDQVLAKIIERFKMVTYQTVHDHKSRLKHLNKGNDGVDIQTEEEE